MGWTGAAIPEEYGGAGLGHLGPVRARRGAGPRAGAGAVLVLGLSRQPRRSCAAGSEAQKKAWLPKLASGEAIGTLALAEGPGKADAAQAAHDLPQRRRSAARSCRCPTATWPTSPSSSRRRDRGIGARARRPARRAASRARPSRPSIRPARTRASPSTARPAEPLGAAGDGERLLRRVQDRAAVLFAFEQVGGAQRCARDGARLRAGALRLRPADRLVPGHQAQAGRRLRRDRAGALQRLLRRLGAARRTRRSCRSPPPRRASRPTRPSAWRPRRTSRCTAAWASPGSSTATSTTAAPSCSRCALGSAARAGRTAGQPSSRRANAAS